MLPRLASQCPSRAIAHSPRAAGVALLLCALFALAPASRAETAAEALAKLYDDYIETRLARFPTSASFLGDQRYYDRLENTADAAFDESREREQTAFLARARAIDRAALPASEQLGYDIFIRDREETLERFAFPDRLMPIDQMSSLASTFALMGGGGSAHPFDTPADYRAFLARADDFARWVDSAIAAMQEGIERGVVNPRAIMEKTVPQLRAIAKDKAEETLFWQPVAAMPSSIPAAEREALTAAYRDKIAHTIVPAYRRLADFIERDYLPHARDTVGLGALPQGEAWYRHQIRRHTTTDMSADEIHALGLTEMARIRGEMEKVMRAVGFTGTLEAFRAEVQNEPRYYARDAEQLLDAFEDIKARVELGMPKLFRNRPRTDYEIRPVEEFRAASASGGSYQPAALDGSRPGIFYVNTFNLKAQPLFSMETLSLHEATPGHHYQITLAQEQATLSRYQRLNSFKAYIEGWALYCETLGQELGLYTDPMQWYGHLGDEMLRAMRLVVDTGMHAKGWSRERAIEFMRENSSMADSDIEAEVERYIAWPGQALAYKIGQLKITELRAHAAGTLGARFDVRDFHDEVLRDGAVPLDILARKVDRYIAARQALATNEAP